MKERIDDRRPKHDFLVHFSFLTSCLIKQTHSRTQRPTVARSNSACCSHLKKKSTFKTTSSCTNMESYSHPGIYQQMNERKTGNLHFLSFFFPMIHFSSLRQKGKSHTTQKHQSVLMFTGDFSFHHPFDCHESRVGPAHCLIIDLLSGWVVCFHKKDGCEGAGRLHTRSLAMHHTTQLEHKLLMQPLLLCLLQDVIKLTGSWVHKLTSRFSKTRFYFL